MWVNTVIKASWKIFGKLWKKSGLNDRKKEKKSWDAIPLSVSQFR